MGSLELIDVEGFQLNEFTDDSPKRSVLEFGHEYPKEFHDLHNDYPLAPVKTEIKNDILYDMNAVSVGKVTKLVSHLFCMPCITKVWSCI